MKSRYKLRKFALIGFPLSHSFSKEYFKNKFETEGIKDAYYELWPIENLAELPAILTRHPEFKGLNVTIPYKESIISFLDAMDPIAETIGAVNTIRIGKQGLLTGYNTDAPGFEKSLLQFLSEDFLSSALVLGSGGASKAIRWVLQKLGIPFLVVSRHPDNNEIGYNQIDQRILETHHLLINTTPLGTFPNAAFCPDIPYKLLGPNHYIYDLVYNPAETTFMRLAAERGARTQNGYDMLINQAEGSWEIWNKKD